MPVGSLLGGEGRGFKILMEKLQQERYSFPITTDYADAAVQSIYAGTNEIMKVFIARRMGLA